MRYISDGRNKKSYRFILCYIVYFVVSQNTLFTVKPFHHLGDCDLYMPPTTGVKERQKQVENDQLVTKRGTTSVAWSRVFKHCSFKTTDFKLLKHKQIYMCAPSLSVWEEHLFFFSDFEQLHKHTYMRQNPRLCKYPHKHSDLGLERVNGRKRKLNVTVY